MTEEIRQAIQLLEENGYKVTAPPKEVKDEYTSFSSIKSLLGTSKIIF